MSRSARRWIVNLLRVAVSVVAVVAVVRMIRWQDYWVIQDAGEQPRYYELPRIRQVVPATDLVRVVWADGHESSHRSAHRGDGFLTLFDHTSKPLFAAMMAAMMIPYFLMSLRWWMLLRGHGFQPRLGQIFFITYAGTFFNNFLPGSVGGDLTKAILAASGEERKAAVAGTVILDRVIGLAVMIVLGATCLTPFVGRFADRRLAGLIYGLLGALMLGYLLYMSPPVRRLVERLPFKKTIAELDGVFRTASDKKALVAKAAGLSFAAQAAGILVIYGFAKALGVAGAALWMFFIFEPIIFIVTALPISVGGWGVQEKIYLTLFTNFGGIDPNQAIALSVLYKLSLILVSIPGGMLFAIGATRRSPPGPS